MPPSKKQKTSSKKTGRSSARGKTAKAGAKPRITVRTNPEKPAAKTGAAKGKAGRKPRATVRTNPDKPAAKAGAPGSKTGRQAKSTVRTGGARRPGSRSRAKTAPAKSKGAAASPLETSTVRSSMRGRTSRQTVPPGVVSEQRKLFLRLTFPGGDVVVFPSPPTLLFGRSDECDVILPQTNVSRRHAEIRRTRDRFKLRDLGSTNGTFRNATRAGELEVTDGDVIQLGDIAILWEILVVDDAGMRPVRDRILADAAARLKRQEPCAFLWLARLARLRRELSLPDPCSHLVVSLPANEAVDVVGMGYQMTGDGQIAERHQLSFRLPPGDALRTALARASQESSYRPDEVKQISSGSREGRLPADLTRLGFASEDVR